MRFGQISIICLLVIFLASPLGCKRIPEEYKEFFDLPRAEREKVIHTYPPEKQVDIFLIGMTVLRPAQIELVQSLADHNGKELLPALIDRIATTDDKDELSALLYLLLDIDMRIYPWRKDPQYIEIAKKAASGMKDSSLKTRVEELILPGVDVSHPPIR